MKTYEARVQFAGKNSGLIETKELSFLTLSERSAFIERLGGYTQGPHNPEPLFRVIATWEGVVYQDWSEADTALLQAYMAPGRPFSHSGFAQH